MLLDQQIPMEKAFTSPAVLRERLGAIWTRTDIADYDPDAFEELFRTPPALHRFPAAMAKRVQALAQTLVAQLRRRRSDVWRARADGADLVRRIGTLPGFGEQKAKIFAALLGKQFAVQPEWLAQAAGDYGEAGSSVRSPTSSTTPRCKRSRRTSSSRRRRPRRRS